MAEQKSSSRLNAFPAAAGGLAMKSVSPLTEAEHITLTAAYHDGPWPAFRQRAYAMLLSAKGYAREAIADILSVNRTTVSLWIDAWEDKA